MSVYQICAVVQADQPLEPTYESVFQRIKVQDDWPPVSILKVSPRVTHNDETPVPVTMNGDKKEVLAEDVHTLHDHMMLATFKGKTCSVALSRHCQGNNMRNRGQTAHLSPVFDPDVVPLCLCQGVAGAMLPCPAIHHCQAMCN